MVVVVKLPDITSGSTTFENILPSIRVLVLAFLVGCKTKDK